MTFEAMLKRILERFDAIDARLDDFDGRLVTLEDRTSESAAAADEIVKEIDGLRRNLSNIHCDCNANEALDGIQELAEAERRRELNEIRAGARSGLRRIS